MKALKILALCVLATLLIVPGIADARVPPAVSNHVRFLKGMDVRTGAGAFKIDGTEVTTDAAEFNVLDGVVAGTATASKALVVGANKNLDTLAIADGGLKLGAGAGTAVTSTAAELNTVDVTAGALTASKALVADASSQIDIVDVTGSFKIDGNPAIQCETVVISTAELLALAATPKVLVAAPGANLFVAVQSVTLALDYATTAYDGVAAGEDLSIQYVGGAVKVTQDIETTGMLDQANDELRFINGAPQALGAAAAADPLIPTVNAGVDITLLTGEIATGDSPLDVRICYSIQPDLLD